MRPDVHRRRLTRSRRRRNPAESTACQWSGTRRVAASPRGRSTTSPILSLPFGVGFAPYTPVCSTDHRDELPLVDRKSPRRPGAHWVAVDAAMIFVIFLDPGSRSDHRGIASAPGAHDRPWR